MQRRLVFGRFVDCLKFRQSFRFTFLLFTIHRMFVFSVLLILIVALCIVNITNFTIVVFGKRKILVHLGFWFQKESQKVNIS